MLRRPPRSTPFPSPTLFRSHTTARAPRHRVSPPLVPRCLRAVAPARKTDRGGLGLRPPRAGEAPRRHAVQAERSEEHTSELQSRLHLVCRLLLEKKKTSTCE